MTTTLFPLPDDCPRQAETLTSEPRVQRPNRRQLQLRPVDLDSLVALDHRARVVWEFVHGLDLSAFYGQIDAVEGHAGRPPIDPAILMALWLYGTLEGIGSARALARLCEEHDAYRWICGGVSVNYHTLADFRVGHGAGLDHILTSSVAALLAEGLVELQRVAQDGVKVRASAGGASFRGRQGVERALAAAAAQVEALRQEVQTESGARSRREAAARERATRERQQRVARALEQLPAVEARRRKAGLRGPARVSTTDREARVMKMADGGYRPAYNAQLATTTVGQVIVGVAVPDAATDLGQLRPMVEQLQRRYGQAPREMLADGGFVTREDIRTLGGPSWGCHVYAPPGRRRGPGRARDHRRRDEPALRAWRARMQTAEGQAIYKERAATSECVNALARQRGLRQFLVRGREKVRAVLLWFALAHNLLRATALRAAAVPAR